MVEVVVGIVVLVGEVVPLVPLEPPLDDEVDPPLDDVPSIVATPPPQATAVRRTSPTTTRLERDEGCEDEREEEEEEEEEKSMLVAAPCNGSAATEALFYWGIGDACHFLDLEVAHIATSTPQLSLVAAHEARSYSPASSAASTSGSCEAISPAKSPRSPCSFCQVAPATP